MKVLAVDVGTGTQDIFLYDSALDLENGYRLAMPSPTMMVHRLLKAATQRRAPVLLTGVLMGGGPSQWAARDHVLAGGRLYATPEAARTFNDDLDYVQKEMGVRVVSEDEARALNGEVFRLELRDFDYPLIANAFANFGVRLDVDAVAVAVFDHGDAPPGTSDRQFRFDYLDARCREAHGLQLSVFAHRADAIPPRLTRLRAVADSARAQGLACPLMVMDTAPAAVLGATLDQKVSEAIQGGALVANVGNFHCLVFRVNASGIGGLFEHHTGEVTREKLDNFIESLAASSLRHQDVFDDMGHGALVYDPVPMPPASPGPASPGPASPGRASSGAPHFLAVTGPRRSLMSGSRHQPYFAAPFGDMMMAGCFGLLAALPDVFPEHGEPIRRSLDGRGGAAPWEAE
jgi:uncharacterized protein (DUF1786 family)